MTNNLRDVRLAYEDVANQSSKNAKEGLLKHHENNQLFMDVLKFVYNPYITTGIAKKKLQKFKDEVSPTSITTTKGLIEYLLENSSGRDNDLREVMSFINSQPEEDRQFLMDIVTKDLKVGITSSTINKVFGKGFIPKFDVMLAKKFEERLIKGKEFIVTTKLDGIRCVALKTSGGIKFFSRQGQPIDGLNDIMAEVHTLPDGVYDGELILKNIEGKPSADLYRDTVKVVRKDGVKVDVEFHIFDTLSVAEFESGTSEDNAIQRKERLHSILSMQEYTWLQEVPVLYKGTEIIRIGVLLEEAIANGKEGVMVNVADAPYECKRTSNILKVKKMHTVDLRVTGFQEGTGKNEGTLGAVLVDYKGYEVGVGSGFSDADREYIWGNRDELLGRIIEVQYFEESNNQDGGLSLRFPVFKCIRELGKQVSYN